MPFRPRLQCASFKLNINFTRALSGPLREWILYLLMENGSKLFISLPITKLIVILYYCRNNRRGHCVRVSTSLRSEQRRAGAFVQLSILPHSLAPNAHRTGEQKTHNTSHKSITCVFVSVSSPMGEQRARVSLMFVLISYTLSVPFDRQSNYFIRVNWYVFARPTHVNKQLALVGRGPWAQRPQTTRRWTYRTDSPSATRKPYSQRRKN